MNSRLLWAGPRDSPSRFASVDTVNWEAEAANWIAFARLESDAYWYYREHFFALVPEPGERTIDIGCGEGRVTRDLDGVTMHFTGWCYPLEGYTRPLEDAGFLIEAFREPGVDESDVSPHGERRLRIPNFLLLRTVKPA